MYNDKSRHICHKYNIVKHLLSNKITFINYVKLKENIADLLTKGLSRELAYNSLRKIGLKPLKDKKKKSNDDNHTVDWRSQDLSSYEKLSHITFLVKLENYYFLFFPIMK
jgi:asparagine synthetase A